MALLHVPPGPVGEYDPHAIEGMTVASLSSPEDAAQRLLVRYCVNLGHDPVGLHVAPDSE
jgi:hypothetical protein